MSLIGKFVTAKLKGCISPRQGWVISESPLAIEGESGIRYECEDSPCIVINPPKRKDFNMSNDKLVKNLKCPECGGDVINEINRLQCTKCGMMGAYDTTGKAMDAWRLWGAAPELLEALKQFITVAGAKETLANQGQAMDGYSELANFRACLPDARAAIAKAEGRE